MTPLKNVRLLALQGTVAALGRVLFSIASVAAFAGTAALMAVGLKGAQRR
jgi:hypothetical protein